MPGGMGGSPNMAQLMKQAQKMQAHLEQAQAELAVAQVSGSAPNGLVTATVNGSGELLALTIQPAVVDPQDIDTLVDLVLVAVQDAQRRAGELQAQAMPQLPGGGLPGLGL